MTPMTLEKEKLLERIKRCLMLGNKDKNNSPEEAATAMAMAHKMMKEHNISLSELQLEEMKNEKVVKGEEVDKKRFKPWERYLATVIARFCSCGIYVNNYWDSETRTKRQKMIFFGLEEDVRIAEQTYCIIRKVILRMSTDRGYEGIDKKSYCLGAVSTIGKRVKAEEERKEEKVSDEEKCTAVMVIKNQLVESYRQQLITELGLKTNKTRRQNIDDNAYSHGKRDGHSVNLRPNQNIIE